MKCLLFHPAVVHAYFIEDEKGGGVDVCYKKLCYKKIKAWSYLLQALIRCNASSVFS